MTLDVTTGELFVPVGNPWPDIDKAYRPGANLFTDSIVVLDARTGALKWWHQVSPEDWMDLDMVAPPVVYRATGTRDIVAFGGKDGYVTGVDRDSRKQLFRVPVTTVEKIPKNPTKEGMKMCPGYAGGVEWNGPALDTANAQLITGAVDACFLVKLGTTEYKAGTAVFGGTVEPVGETTGWITAIDAETGAVRWKYHAEKPVVAGITPTAGGITFAGDLAGNFLVFDSKTGNVVHKAKAGGAMAAGLVTYEHAGKQYVAYGAGNISRNAFGDLGFPSVVILTLNPGRPGTVSDATGATRAASAGGGADLSAGRRLYSQVCVACHGPDGNMISDHKLAGLRARRDLPATIAYLKDPKPPMPKMYPDLLTEQSLVDVAAYVHDELK